MITMNIEQIAVYGNSIGGVVILACLAIIWIVSRRMGRDERSEAIFLRVYSSMFYVLAALIALSIFFGFGHDISGLMYQKITSLMFALSVIFRYYLSVHFEKKVLIPHLTNKTRKNAIKGMKKWMNINIFWKRDN